MHINKYIFPFIVAISAFLVEACAAFFSVYGLAKLFAGATIAIIAMAISLEIGKIVAASFLYRHWKTIKLFMKFYLIPAILTLMLITSIGIYGFLSNAFQTSTIGYEKQGTQLIIYEQQKTQYTQDRERIIAQLKDLRVSSRLDMESIQRSERDSTGVIYNRERTKAEKRYKATITDYEKQLHITDSTLSVILVKVADLKMNLVSTGTDVGPIIYVARAFNMEIGTVVQWLILIFIFVFDPLAIVLILATNKVFLELDGGHRDESRKGFFSRWKKSKNVVIDATIEENKPLVEQTISFVPPNWAKHVVVPSFPPESILEEPQEPSKEIKKSIVKDDDQSMGHPMPKIVG